MLWELTRRERVLRWSIRMVRSGLDMRMAFDGREPYYRCTFSNQEELDAGVAEEKARAETEDWAPS